MKPKISLITLGVSDLERSVKFYRDSMGFKTHHYKEGDDHVMFVMEGSWLALYPIDKLAEDATIPMVPGFAGITLAHNVKTKEEVERVFDMAVSAGAKPIKIPQNVYWGGFSGYFADPDGYLWEIDHNPFTDLT